ncbi:hypothetical protein EXA20_16425 [Vibrio cincinnatiensis]|jgi:hypothetical protein|uniref:hypothetical protein n=1 Tax=Vibrio cincinnatiensis TaxID=675 RepID=UPI001EE11CC0|nr:hypothetical protein [Vibrio cincinnatiensis]MCG3748564.1 hypothetical protein [Vibrio cincinnatiensis]
MTDDKDREIRKLNKLLKMRDASIEQLKQERHAALDRAFDVEERLKEAEHVINTHSGGNRGAHDAPLGSSCPNCSEYIEQYDRMRAAFERRKQDQKAISAALNENKWLVDGKPLTLNRLIKMGKAL